MMCRKEMEGRKGRGETGSIIAGSRRQLCHDYPWHDLPAEVSRSVLIAGTNCLSPARRAARGILARTLLRTTPNTLGDTRHVSRAMTVDSTKDPTKNIPRKSAHTGVGVFASREAKVSSCRLPLCYNLVA